MKFLGIKYHFRSGEVQGATRNGSTLKFGARQKGVLDLLKKLVPSQGSLSSASALVQSSIFGTALAKLYGGKFGKLDYPEHQIFAENSY